ncbi:MAG: Tim44-like domain-containing protein [Hydrogenophaga sp.]|nr:Tim44-like domain-containing protein [Hydrogenophaga sp.]
MSGLGSVLLVCALLLGSQNAWSKRLGDGLSVGKQSSAVAPRNGVEPAPASAQARSGTASPAAASSQRPWGAMVGGLAAGLGLAWLASSLGFGEGLAQVLLLALVALAVFAAVRLLMVRRAPAAPRSGLAFQSANASGQSQFDPATPRGYSPKNVGNDASARPWESAFGEDAADPVAGGPLPWGVPDGFDTDGFLQASKTNFVSLQAAWDRADIPSLRAMMTDAMLEQIKSQLAEREQHTGGQPNKTEVVMLEARLLGIEELEDSHMASVEFSGLVREEVSAGPNPFREVWNITRPKGGSGGWLVAGVQALQ